MQIDFKFIEKVLLLCWGECNIKSLEEFSETLGVLLFEFEEKHFDLRGFSKNPGANYEKGSMGEEAKSYID